MFYIISVAIFSILVILYFCYGRSEGLFIVLFVSLFLAIPAFYPAQAVTGGFIDDYSQGQRTGYIIKLSNSGLIWKTWDGAMQLGTGNISSLQQPFKFSIVDDALVQSIKSAIDGGVRVRLTYQQYFIPNWRKGDTGYIITKIEELNQ